MKTFFKISLLSIAVTLVTSCNNSSTSQNSECDDMRAYNKGVEMGNNDKLGASVTGVRSSCSEVYEIADQSYDKSCFCKGYNSID